MHIANGDMNLHDNHEMKRTFLIASRNALRKILFKYNFNSIQMRECNL